MGQPNEPAFGPGYMSRHFIESFSDYGDPIVLPSSNCRAIRRSIPVSSGNYFDVIGTYPMIFTTDPTTICNDLYLLASRDNAVSFTAVLNPFEAQILGGRDFYHIGTALFRKFKPHVIYSLEADDARQISVHHRKRMLKANKDNTFCKYITDHEERVISWYRMQSLLNQKKGLSGLKAMNMSMVESQASINELDIIGYYIDNELHGVSTWMVQEEAAFSHTTAMTDEGRKNLAGYAMYGFAIATIKDLHSQLRVIDFGSYASSVSMSNRETNGLDYFKCGWSDGRLYSYLVTSVLNQKLYEEVCKKTNTQDVTNYFPAYRNGELL